VKTVLILVFSGKKTTLFPFYKPAIDTY